jgi:hypothetical protein
MSLVIRSFALLALFLLPGLAATLPARADSFKFLIQSENPYYLRLEFYSPSRNLYWPGNGKSWHITDYQSHTYSISCKHGEQVCYGAWQDDRSLIWGVGKQHEQSCTSCCYVCSNTTTKLITLSPY